jgi:hypothetical protein
MTVNSRYQVCAEHLLMCALEQLRVAGVVDSDAIQSILQIVSPSDSGRDLLERYTERANDTLYRLANLHNPHTSTL